MMLTISSPLDSTKKEESLCITVASILHAMLLFWNPTLLSSHYKPIHDFVTIDIVEQGSAGGGDSAEAPKKMGLMDTLKDMLMKPRTEEIAHISPQPPTHRVAAPIQPALQEKTMPRPIASMFQPKSQTEDLAAQSSPNSIQTQSKNYNIPTPGPALTSKSFGGIRAKDLPFQVGTDQQITGGGAVIPIAVGDKSAKSALGYSAPSLQDAGKRSGINVSPGTRGPAGDLNSLGGGGAQTIQISGTGGTGNAPTGATSGSVLQDRAGVGGGRVGRGLFGSGGGRGSGIGSGSEGIPGAAAALEAQLDSGGSSGRSVKSKKGFDIAGPLNNRPILHKVIPQYPAWAEEQGIIGSVRIWFTVTPEGQVRSNMRVTKTTGYPELDKLALDALKQWRFAGFASADEASQWGIITFTFSLSS
jgi:TonB family protein